MVRCTHSGCGLSKCLQDKRSYMLSYIQIDPNDIEL